MTSSTPLSSPFTRSELKRARFRFLKRLNSFLAEYANRAAEFGHERPEECLVNLRKFAEYVVIYLESAGGVRSTVESDNSGDEETGAQLATFAERLKNLTASGYLPDEIRREIAYIWFYCGEYGAHAPKTFLVTDNQVLAHKDQVNLYVRPGLEAALKVARWVQKECSNKEDWIAWVFRRPIGLKSKLQKARYSIIAEM